MKKGIMLSLLVINVLYASENITNEKTYGLFFGNLAQVKDGANYGRWNALLGCLHNRGGSDVVGFSDCTELVQGYSNNIGGIDSTSFRDNIWCMESSNANLGKNEIPSASEFERDIYNNSNVYNFRNNANLNYITSITKYKDGEYQESYKNLQASTTGRLMVIARNKDDYNPFSFYLTNNINTNRDFTLFVRDYVGLINGKMRHDYIKQSDLEREYWKLTSIYEGWLANITDERVKDEYGNVVGCGANRYSGCNAINGYKGDFVNGKPYGCGVSDWSELQTIERYVRFYYDLENYGCTIRPVDYFDDDGQDVILDSKGSPLYAAIIDDNKKRLYYRSYTGGTTGQVRTDALRIAKAKNFNLGRVINGNETCKQAIEQMSVKNISTYGTREFGNSSDFLFFNNNNLDKGTIFQKDLFKNNGIGKCYFTNLQYYDRKNNNGDFTAFPAITAHKFLWGDHNRFLQNYLKSDGKYAVASYSIDRKNIYKSDKPGSDTGIFSLHTRPTSFRGVDENKYGNTKNGRLEAKYNLIFYPDANDTKMGLIYSNITETTMKVKNAPSNLNDIKDNIPLINSLEFGASNNTQLSFMQDDEELNPNRIDFNNKKCNIETNKECENMNFKISFRYKIHKLKKEGGYFDLISEDKDYKSGTYTIDSMAVRVNENLLNAINYDSKKDGPILLEMEVENGYYASDDRPFFEQNSKDIIKAKKVGRFVAIVDIDFSGNDIAWGSIWDLNDVNKLPDINSSSAKYDEKKAFTRVVGTPVYLGIKNKSKKQFIGSDTFIVFRAYQVDNNNKRNELNSSKIKFYDGLSEVKLNNDNKDLFNNEKIKNFIYKGSRPYYDGVLKLDNLEVGRYEVCYDIYSINDINDAINKSADKDSIEVPIKASDCTNVFSVRPAFIEYTTNTNFIAGENALSGGKLTKFEAKLKDSKKNAIKTNENFAITKTNLIVEDSKTNKFAFELNNKNRSVISSVNSQALIKQNDYDYLITDVYVNFPFSTSAKLDLFEGKFSEKDANGGYCESGSANNSMNSDGKVGCLIQSENTINLNFTSTADYSLKTPIINNPNTNTKVFFKNDVGDNNSLKIPFVFNNLGVNNPASLPYVYHKFSDNRELEYDLYFDNNDSEAKDRYLVNIDEKYADNTYKLNIIKDNIKITKVIVDKDKLNQEFDKKLQEFYNETRTKNINGVIEYFAAKPDNISVDLELAYLKHKTTTDNKNISNTLVKKPNVAEFSLLKTSTISEGGNTFNPNKDYSFIFTGVTYKDSKIDNSNTITLNSSDLELFYLDKRGLKVKFTPETPTYKKSAKDILDELSFIGDYGSKFDKKNGNLDVTLNASHSNKQYVKEIVNVSNTSDLSGIAFSIEFVNK